MVSLHRTECPCTFLITASLHNSDMFRQLNMWLFVMPCMYGILRYFRILLQIRLVGCVRQDWYSYQALNFGAVLQL